MDRPIRKSRRRRSRDGSASVRPGRAALAWLAVAGVLVGCAAPPPAARDNEDLRQSIHAAVPADWRDAAAATDSITPLQTSPELREFLQAKVRSNAVPRDRMLSLVATIVDDDGIGLEYRADATYTAAEAYSAGAGNCLGFANLLIASARELGLDANYELVSHRQSWQKVDDVLVGSLHVRVSSIVSGRRMVFDFYPLPLESGYTTHPLSDSDAHAHHLNNLAADAMQAGDDARAYALIYTAIGTAPNIAFIWSNLGTLLLRHDLYEPAEAAFREALAISPDWLSALSNLQRLYVRQGRIDDSRALEQELVRHRERNPYYHAAQGEEAVASGSYDAAVGHFRAAIRLNRNEPDFYAGLAKSYAAQGNNGAAERAAQKAEALRQADKVSYVIGTDTGE